MWAAIIVVVAVDKVRAADAPAPTLSSSAEDTLEPGSVVIVRELEAPSDDTVLDLQRTLHADAVVVVTWPEPGRRAHIHLRSMRQPAWSDRDLDFRPNDSAEERARTIGFAVATMIPKIPTESPSRPASVGPEEPQHRFGVDGALVAGTGLGGYAGGIGAETGGRLYLGSGIAVRAGLGLRFGDIPPARASLTLLRVDAGLAWSWRAGGRLTYGARADAVLVHEGLSRVSSDGHRSSGGRWLPGADLLVEGGWSVHPAVAVVGALGTELVPESTQVFVGGAKVATLAPIHLLGELGIRFSF